MQKKDDKEGNKTACQREREREKKERARKKIKIDSQKKTFYVSQILAHARARKSKQVLDFVS